MRPVTRKSKTVTLATAVAVALGVFALAAPASADSNNFFVQPGNASDPSAFPCQDPNSSSWGYCLVTSTDMHMTPQRVGTLGENYYPMQTEQVFFSADGLNWRRTSSFNESTLGIYDPWHLWAPTVRTVHAGSNGPRPTSNYYLYTPDVLSSADKYSSRIWLTYSWTVSSSSAQFGYTPIYGLSSGATRTQIQGVPTAADIDTFKSYYPLYMSDPAVFTDTPDPDHASTAYENNDYLMWADGDYGTCGGLSLRKMTNHWTVQQFHNPSEAWLNITGLNSGTDALGTCTKTYPLTDQVNVGRPYLEGGEMYHSNWWAHATTPNEGMPGPYVIVFAAKPDHVPARCTSAWGEPNTDNEVIGYATSNSVGGPYQYRGIIMCGSATEWTNQATIEQVKAPDGTYRLVLIYHDGPDAGSQGNTRNRKLHAECLYAIDGAFVKTMRTDDGVVNADGIDSWCIARSKITALTSASTGMYVSARPGGLVADAGEVGPWEQFSRMEVGGYTRLVARNGDKYVTTNTTQLQANGTTQSTATRFTFENVYGTKYRIKDYYGRYMQTTAGGVLRAGSTSPSASDTSYQFWLQTLTN